MKLKYRFLIPTLITVSLALALFGGALIRSSFLMQLDGQRHSLAERMRLAGYAVKSAYASYAIQNIRLSDERLADLARAQGGDIALTRAEDPVQGRIWLEGRILRAQSRLTISGANYALTIERDISELYAWRALMIARYQAVYSLAICLIGGALLAIASGVTRPLSEIARASRELADGKLDTRVCARSRGEVGALALAFNDMADALCEQLERQKRFIENLTHELKTPLTSIIGHADTIRSGKLDAENAQIAAQTIFREGRRLDALSGILTEWILLKRDSPQFHELSTFALLYETVARFSVSPGRVFMHNDAQDAVIRGDRALMSSVLSNLVANALNAGAKEVELNCEFEGDNTALISVSDDGCGMTADELAHITEPFYRADKARSRSNGGAGLGLTLSDEIVKLHGGILRFVSEPAQGTRAIIEITGRKVETNV